MPELHFIIIYLLAIVLVHNNDTIPWHSDRICIDSMRVCETAVGLLLGLHNQSAQRQYPQELCGLK